MNRLYAIDFPSKGEAESALARARTLQPGETLRILDAAPAPHRSDETSNGTASVLVLVADVTNEEAVAAALAVLGGTIRHTAIAPYAGSRIREVPKKRPAGTEPEVEDAVASLDRG
jgi:uncharacterized membrane protein